MTLAEPWPLSIVTGFLGSGKTTLITRLLRRADMADTVVIVNEFGEIGLDHHLLRQVTDAVLLLPNGCLCCTIRQDIVQTLRELHRGWLAGDIPDFARVLVETTGLAEPSALLASLVGHPLLADVFALRAVVTVIDAEYGSRHLTNHPACWQQVCVADHLVIAKCDIAQHGETEALRRRVADINPLASIRLSPADGSPGFLFERTTGRPTRPAFACFPAPDHLAEVEALVLRPGGPLSWRKFQVWLNDVLERFGDHILRVKGCLLFDGSPTRMIIQAVHQTFYPVAEAPGPMDANEEFLVFITNRPLEADLVRGLDLCRAVNRLQGSASDDTEEGQVRVAGCA